MGESLILALSKSKGVHHGVQCFFECVFSVASYDAEKDTPGVSVGVNVINDTVLEPSDSVDKKNMTLFLRNEHNSQEFTCSTSRSREYGFFCFLRDNRRCCNFNISGKIEWHIALAQVLDSDNISPRPCLGRRSEALM